MRFARNYGAIDYYSPSILPTEIMLVTGPPCSGKSTYVEQHKKVGDLVFDFDQVASAITGIPSQHGGWPDGVRAYVLALRDAFIAKAQRGKWVDRVWVISSTAEGLLSIRANTIEMNTPQQVCLQRASERGPEQLEMVQDWFRRNP